ncbi:hypothetical protein ACH347_02345 [Saccharopolyspora sp. 5N102]|uniref:hypothetical protein n=1 Tax=Saccharopolyspora sp. 5N102 TaxID=3375155 RepID=UPI0037B9478D
MGAPSATAFTTAGYETTVWNRNAAKDFRRRARRYWRAVTTLTTFAATIAAMLSHSSTCRF